MQDHTDVGTGTRHSHLHGIAFPVQPQAMTAIQQFKQKEVDYVQMVCKTIIIVWSEAWSCAKINVAG